MILITDSETGVLLVDTDATEGENPDALGTYIGPLAVSGVVYHGVKAWIGPALLDPTEKSVFVEWTDESSSNPMQPNPGRVHTVERSLPGGAVFRFLVAASE